MPHHPMPAQDADDSAAPLAGPSPPPFAAPARRRPPLVLFLVLMALGLSMLLVLAWAAVVAHERTPWRDALIAVSPDPPWDGMIEVWVRELPRSELPEAATWWEEVVELLSMTGEGREVLTQMRVDRHEQVIALDVPTETLRPMLEAGRLPEPGAPEVLAGDLARFEAFELDGTRFEVVGRLKRGVSAVLFGYVLPYDPAYDGLFSDSEDARRAWLDSQGLLRLAEVDSADPEAALPDDAELMGGLSRAPDWIAFGNVVGLVLVIVASAGTHIMLFRWLSRRRAGALAPVFRATIRWPRLFVSLHLAFFGLFVGSTLTGIVFPLGNMRLMYLFRHAIEEGGLEYVGRAYQSENILWAAAATFANNYLLQTVVLTLGISLLVPFAGLVKNAASFAVAGFGLAPIWTPMLPVFPFHSITIAVELEAYIVACFAVTLWPVYLARGVWRGSIGEVLRGLAIVGSAGLLAGLILALAGLYEAATLILLK